MQKKHFYWVDLSKISPTKQVLHFSEIYRIYYENYQISDLEATLKHNKKARATWICCSQHRQVGPGGSADPGRVMEARRP